MAEPRWWSSSAPCHCRWFGRPGAFWRHSSTGDATPPMCPFHEPRQPEHGWLEKHGRPASRAYVRQPACGDLEPVDVRGQAFTQRAQPHARWCSRPDPGAAWRSSGWIVLCSSSCTFAWRYHERRGSCCWGAALHKYLLARGESVEPIAVAVPVSGRRRGGRREALVAPMLVEVSTSGGVPERIAQVEAAVRAHKKAATGPPPIAILGGMFRLLARLGVYRFYMNHQHRLHTLVSHVRGPAEPMTLGGHQVALPYGRGWRGRKYDRLL